MLSSDFTFFLVLFFFILALAFIAPLVFMESWEVGPLVWAEATDTLPTRAAQHAAMSRFRILISCWNISPGTMKARVPGLQWPLQNCARTSDRRELESRSLGLDYP